MREEVRIRDKAGISKVKLAIGAASLFLFIVGVKRSYQHDEPETEEGSQAADR